MNVSLTPKLASEVVREALRLLQKEDDATHDRKVARLRRAIQAGIDSPDAEDFDMKKLIERVKKRSKS